MRHAWPSSTSRRGGSPARRRRSRRSIPRRGCRAPRRSGRRPRRWRCPSRSPRRSRRDAGASAPSGGGDRSGSGRGAAPSRTCSPATRGGPCRRGCARSGGRRRRPAAPRSRSCTRTRCTPCCATQLSTWSLQSEFNDRMHWAGPVGQAGVTGVASVDRWTAHSPAPPAEQPIPATPLRPHQLHEAGRRLTERRPAQVLIDRPTAMRRSLLTEPPALSHWSDPSRVHRS